MQGLVRCAVATSIALGSAVAPARAAIPPFPILNVLLRGAVRGPCPAIHVTSVSGEHSSGSTLTTGRPCGVAGLVLRPGTYEVSAAGFRAARVRLTISEHVTLTLVVRR